MRLPANGMTPMLLNLPVPQFRKAREPLTPLPNWFWGNLKPRAYGVIVIDAPWEQEMYSGETGIRKAPQSKYPCMSLDEIKALPIAQLAAPNCYVVVWGLWNFVAPGYVTDVIRAWNAVPKSGGAWFKITKHGKAAMGTGYGFRGCNEPFLTAAYGAPKVISHSERNGIITEIEVDADIEFNTLLAKLRQHSRKPDQMREALERMFPGVAKVEIFARERFDGWDSWGNQVDAGLFTEGAQ